MEKNKFPIILIIRLMSFFKFEVIVLLHLPVISVQPNFDYIKVSVRKHTCTYTALHSPF